MNQYFSIISKESSPKSRSWLYHITLRLCSILISFMTVHPVRCRCYLSPNENIHRNQILIKVLSWLIWGLWPHFQSEKESSMLYCPFPVAPSTCSMDMVSRHHFYSGPWGISTRNRRDSGCWLDSSPVSSCQMAFPTQFLVELVCDFVCSLPVGDWAAVKQLHSRGWARSGDKTVYSLVYVNDGHPPRSQRSPRVTEALIPLSECQKGKEEWKGGLKAQTMLQMVNFIFFLYILF